MSSRPELRLDWCSHEAAKYAVEHWHYSRRMPVGKSARVGVWEDGQYIGAILFSWGANRHLSGQFGLLMTECAECVRVAITHHRSPVSRMLAVAISLVRKQSPGLRLIVSFADPAHGHHGGIYQASGWMYSGRSEPVTSYRLAGVTLMRRAYTGHNFGQPKLALPAHAIAFKSPGKHRYVMPLDAEMRARIAPFAKPYPKRERSRENAAPPPRGEGGAIPTRSLQSQVDNGG